MFGYSGLDTGLDISRSRGDTEVWKTKLLSPITRLTTSVPVSASFTELDAATALHLGLIIKLTENPAKIAAKMARPIRSQDLLLVT